MSKIYNSKWFPRLFYIKPDGGIDSGVTAYFLIEWKILFSIGILHFREGTREAYHTHAFTALTWWLKGKVTEYELLAIFNHKNEVINRIDDIGRDFKVSIIPKYTPRGKFHKIRAHIDTYALTFRGPWSDSWYECRKNKLITLTHGRKEI